VAEGSLTQVTLSVDQHSAAVLKQADFIISYKFGTVRLRPKGQLKKSAEGNKDQAKGGTLAGPSKSTSRKGMLQPGKDEGASSSQLPKGKGNPNLASAKGIGKTSSRASGKGPKSRKP